MIAVSWVALLLFPSLLQTPAQPASPCTETASIRRDAPRVEGADPLGPGPWFINADETIWALKQPWRPGAFLKTAWIKPSGSALTVVGRRLDGSAPALRVSMPAVYASGFQASALMFPTPGCWEVTAKAGMHTLTFVTRIGV